MLLGSHFPVGDTCPDHGDASLSPVLEPLQVGRGISTVAFDPHNDQMRSESSPPFYRQINWSSECELTCPGPPSWERQVCVLNDCDVP